MKFTHVTGICFKNCIFFFHKICLIMSTVFPPLREKLYARCLKHFAEATEHFVHARFQPVVFRKTTSSECILQGAKKIEV